MRDSEVMAEGKRRAKLAHVAVHSGVSLGTASDALRGKGRISEETRERVLESARILGYRPSAQARTLATGHSYIVALVVHEHSTTAGPRIYWPKLQAEFTERLLEHRLVACTMALADLDRLDGLPFDLVVFAHLQSDDLLPQEIRSNYQVMDIDLAGDTAEAASLRSQFSDLCEQTFKELAKKGVKNPVLILPAGAAVEHPAVKSFEAWCDANERRANVVAAHSDVLPMIPSNVDGIFSILVDPDWLVMGLKAQKMDPDLVSIICLGPEPQRPESATAVARLTIDGRAVGRQLADLAADHIYNRSPSQLELAWLLDGKPF